MISTHILFDNVDSRSLLFIGIVLVFVCVNTAQLVFCPNVTFTRPRFFFLSSS